MLDTHEPIISKDDEDWIAILSGQSVPDADPDTIREARTLRMVLLARKEEEMSQTDEKDWQVLKNKLGLPPEPKPFFNFLPGLNFSSIANQVAEVLTWKKLSLAAVYTVLVSTVTLTFSQTRNSDQAQMQPKSVGPGEGHDQGQTQVVPYFVIPFSVADIQQKVRDLQQELTDKGVDNKDIAIFQSNSEIMVAIPVAKNPSRNLRNLYQDYKIDSEHNQRVFFLVKPKKPE